MELKCIAIFDDYEDILHVTRLILAQEYEQVEVFSSCQNLIEDIERIRPDLILLDIRIPGLQGEESLLLIHASEKQKIFL
jgi:DNA-binding response OmpR family regulator